MNKQERLRLEEAMRHQLRVALEAMDLNPSMVPYPGALMIYQDISNPLNPFWAVEFDEFVLNTNGQKILDPVNKLPRTVRRTMVLKKHPREYGWPL